MSADIKSSNAEKLRALQRQVQQSSGVDNNDKDGGDQKSDETYAHRTYEGDHVTDEAADRLIKQAEKKLKKPAFLADKNRYENCVELYQRAGTTYRANENWVEAASAFIKAAELCETKLKNEVEASHYYTKAARCYVNTDMDEALKIYALSVAIHMNAGKLDSAAKLWTDIATLLKEEDRLAEALEAWQKSANCHEAADTLTSAVQCYLSMADIYIQNEDYAEAAELFRKAAQISVEKNINIGSHQEFYFKAILCEFLLAARRDFDTKLPQQSYKAALQVNRRYEGTREFNLLKNLFKAFDDEDVAAYTKYIYHYNQQKELSSFESQILLRIKQIMKEGPKDEAGEEVDLL